MTSVWSFTWFQCQLNIVNANRMPHMIRMLVKRLNCVTLRLSNTLFIYILKLHNHGVPFYKTSSREQIIQKYKALKEFKEKGTFHKDVASLFRVTKNTLSTWKKTKDKIFEKYNSGLKPCINNSLFYEVKMFQSVTNAQGKGYQIRRRTEHWGISSFWRIARKMEKDIKYTFLYISTYILKTLQKFTELFLENFN